MREIKFRQWDSVHKRMQYGSGATEPSGWIAFANVSWGRYPIMQYTGIKDKNGVEIYEGDIVLHRKPGFSEMVHGEVFIEPTRGVVVKNWPISFDIEVIGNKYEHPELLEDS